MKRWLASSLDIKLPSARAGARGRRSPNYFLTTKLCVLLWRLLCSAAGSFLFWSLLSGGNFRLGRLLFLRGLGGTPLGCDATDTPATRPK